MYVVCMLYVCCMYVVCMYVVCMYVVCMYVCCMMRLMVRGEECLKIHRLYLDVSVDNNIII